MVADACNSSTWEPETGGSQVCGQPQLLSEALCNLVRPHFKIKNKLGVVAHACNPSTWEAETGGSQICSQPQLLSENLCNLMRPCFNIKE